MACNKRTMAVFTVVAAVLLLAAAASAEDFVVGDGKGWTLGADYTDWAMGKQFRVGDRLIFNYGTPAHNVAKADGASFNACAVPSGTEPLTSGKDVITLSTAGNKWYLCSKADHCRSGMKLFINVEDSKSKRRRRRRLPKSASSRTSASQCRIFTAVSALVVMTFNV